MDIGNAIHFDSVKNAFSIWVCIVLDVSFLR